MPSSSQLVTTKPTTARAGHLVYDPSTGIYSSPWAVPAFPTFATAPSVYAHIVGSLHSAPPDVLRRVALKECDEQGRALTYAQLLERSQAVGLGLQRSLGLKQGDVIMLSAANSIEWIVFLFAAQYAGLKISLANPMYLSKELAHVRDLTKPRYLFIQARNLQRYLDIGIDESQLILLDEEAQPSTKLRRVADLELSASDLDALRKENGGSLPPAAVPPSWDETVFLPCSSGTTGLPKAVELTHSNVVHMLSLLNGIPHAYEARALRSLCFLPFFHAFALLTSVLLSPLNRGTLHVLAPFDAARFVATVARERIETTQLVPPIIAALSTSPSLKREMFASLRFAACGGAALDGESQQRIWERLGINVIQGFGQTEQTVGLIGMCADAKPGTVGWIMPAAEARLVDDEDRDVKIGERGELLVRGPNIMKGYYLNAAATKETFLEPGRWLRTGDIALCDPSTGEFAIVDRKKELIKYKGYQVAPAELEGLLKAHPKVRLAAVIGIYDKQQMTELPRAYIELAPHVPAPKDGAEEQALCNEFDQFIRGQTSTHKYLRGGIKILPQVPAR